MIEYVNPAFETTTGFSRQEAGRPHPPNPQVRRARPGLLRRAVVHNPVRGGFPAYHRQPQEKRRDILCGTDDHSDEGPDRKHHSLRNSHQGCDRTEEAARSADSDEAWRVPCSSSFTACLRRGLRDSILPAPRSPRTRPAETISILSLCRRLRRDCHRRCLRPRDRLRVADGRIAGISCGPSRRTISDIGETFFPDEQRAGIRPGTGPLRDIDILPPASWFRNSRICQCRAHSRLYPGFHRRSQTDSGKHGYSAGFFAGSQIQLQRSHQAGAGRNSGVC